MLGETAEVRLVGDRDRDVGPSASARRCPAARPPAEVRCHRTRSRRSAGRRRRPPRRRRPAPRRRVAGDRRWPPGRRGRRRSSSTQVWPRGRSIRTGSKTSPPSPTSPPASESTAISRREHDGAVRVETDDGRRPARSAVEGAPRSSVTRSAADSSPMSAADGAARQTGPRDQLGARGRTGRWSSRTMALRFARRTVSLRCRSPPDASITGLCSSLLKCCDRLVQGPAVSSIADLRAGCRRPGATREEVAMESLDGRVALVTGRQPRDRSRHRHGPSRGRASASDSPRAAATTSASPARSPGRPTCATRRRSRRSSTHGRARSAGSTSSIVNAGVGAYGPFLDLPDEHIEEMIDVNVKGAIYAVRAALPAPAQERRRRPRHDRQRGRPSRPAATRPSTAPRSSPRSA